MEKFCDLAVALLNQARLFDDGLYRAVDVYLMVRKNSVQAHPWISEAEREKICGVMDYQRFTLEACTHAAGTLIAGTLFWSLSDQSTNSKHVRQSIYGQWGARNVAFEALLAFLEKGLLHHL
ncbi:hypothetical protein L1049_018055 [Liquidambar formosana]|uniref:NPH3 domain-containing protein n=1 Tax=Liquidambar formosana TaxID=63359 RepID=A0AAP0NIF7_LIQFO